MKIRVVVPLRHDRFDREALREFSLAASPQTELSAVHLDEGPDSIESEYEEALAVPGILKCVQQAERDGCHAVISDCFGDPGVRPARELIDIPVIGPAEASMMLASALGSCFSVVTVLQSVVPMIRNLAAVNGVASKLASVRTVEIPVLALGEKARLEQALFEEMLAAVKEDGAHVLILGCTGMIGVSESLERRLGEAGHAATVVSPALAALKMAETLVALNLRYSRLTYSRPKNLQTTASH